MQFSYTCSVPRCILRGLLVSRHRVILIDRMLHTADGDCSLSPLYSLSLSLAANLQLCLSSRFSGGALQSPQKQRGSFFAMQREV